MTLNNSASMAMTRRIVRLAAMLLVLVVASMLAIGSADRLCPEIDPNHTTILAEEEGTCTTTFWVCPRNSLGVNLGPGYALYIRIDPPGITMALEDLGDGTYRAIVHECLEEEIASRRYTVGCTETLRSESEETSGKMHDPQISLTIDVDPETVRCPGGDVTYTYIVTNTGDDPLHDVVVVDDNGTPGEEEQAADDILPVLVSGDGYADGILDLDEVWIFRTTQNRVRDIHTTATVSALGTVSVAQRVSAHASTTVDVRTPAIDIQTTASPDVVHADESVTYIYAIRNTGDDPLTDVELVFSDEDGNPADGLYAVDPNGNGILDIGETWDYRRVRQLSQTTLTTAEASGADSWGTRVAGDTTIEVEVIHPAMEADLFAAPALSECPTQVTYTYEIRNTGDVPLTDVVVQGDSETDHPFTANLTSGDDGNQVLDVGEVWRYEALINRDADTVSVVRASGIDPAGRSVDCVSQVAIEILISSWHIDVEPEPTILYAGESVTYTYRAVNDGEAALHDVRVYVDSRLDAVSEDGHAPQYVSGDDNDNGLLDPGECWVFSADLVPGEDLITRGEASALDPCENPLFAMSDPVNVNVIHPALTVHVSVEPGKVYPDDAAVSTYELTNTGDDPLRHVSLIDSNGDGPQLNPSLTGGDDNRDRVLNVGESWVYVSRRVPTQDMLGIVTATAQDSLQQSISASTEYAIDVMTTDLSVSRTMSPLAANKGDRVTFRYEVTNHGDVPVEDIIVTDDSGTPDDVTDDVHPIYVSGDAGDRILDAGEAWVYELSAYLSDEHLAARATATGATRRASTSIRAQPPVARVEKLGLGDLHDLELGTSCEELALPIPEIVRTWNPLLVDPYSSFMTTIHRGLTRRNPVSGSAELDLAKHIEVSGYEVIVELHEGLQWSDGEPFTAEDVVFTYNALFAYTDADVPYRSLFALPALEPVDQHASPWEASIFDVVDIVDPWDEHTVVFILSEWPGDLPVIRDQVWDALRTPILPQHVLEANVAACGLDGVWELGIEPEALVGMGPYIVSEYSDTGTDNPYVDRVVLERNPHYAVSDHAGTPLPYADRVVFHLLGNYEKMDFLTETSYRYDSESVDAISIPLNRVAVARECADSMDYSVCTEPLPATTWLVFNQNARSSERDWGEFNVAAELCRTRAFRQAVAHLIDRDELGQLLMEQFVPIEDPPVAATSWSLLDPRSPYHYDRSAYGEAVSQEPEQPYPFAPSEAARLLEQAGLIHEEWYGSDLLFDPWRRDPVELSIGYWNDPDCLLASLIRDLLSDSGLTVRVEDASWGNPFAPVRGFDMTFATMWDVRHLYELNRYLSPFGDQHFWSLFEERRDDSLTETEEQIWELFNRTSWSFAPEEVFEIYSEMQTLFAQGCVMIPIAKDFVTYAINDGVHNAKILFEHYPGSPMGLEYVYKVPE